MFLCVLDYIRWSCVLCGQCYAFRLHECLLCAQVLTGTFLCSIATMKIHHTGSIVYYVCLWYCSCHRPYAVFHRPSGLSIALYGSMAFSVFGFAFQNFLNSIFMKLNFENDWNDKNYFISTRTTVNRYFVKRFLLKAVLLNTRDINYFVEIAVARYSFA